MSILAVPLCESERLSDCWSSAGWVGGWWCVWGGGGRGRHAGGIAGGPYAPRGGVPPAAVPPGLPSTSPRARSPADRSAHHPHYFQAYRNRNPRLTLFFWFGACGVFPSPQTYQVCIVVRWLSFGTWCAISLLYFAPVRHPRRARAPASSSRHCHRCW
jgi:hypothetical protein